jgi:XisI protein
MEINDSDRIIIEKILTELSHVKYANGEIKSITLFDRTNDHYLLIDMGWSQYDRIYGPLVHIDLIDGKFWIQQDGTERGVAEDLLVAGIPKERIVLAFQHMSRRKYGQFAAA